MNTRSVHWRGEPIGDALTAWIDRVPTVVRSPLVMAGIAAVLALVLLGAFYQTVRGAVEKGQSERAAATAHADAVWRCNIEGDRHQRNSCKNSLIAARNVQGSIMASPANQARPMAVAHNTLIPAATR